MNWAKVNSSVRVNYFCFFHWKIIEIYYRFLVACGWLLDHQCPWNRLGIFPKTVVITQSFSVCQCACSLGFSLVDFAFILEACLYELNLSEIVRFELELSLVKKLLWAVKVPIADRCSFLPKSPVILLFCEMFHDFLSIEIHWILIKNYCAVAFFRWGKDRLLVFRQKWTTLFWV